MFSFKTFRLSSFIQTFYPFCEMWACGSASVFYTWISMCQQHFFERFFFSSYMRYPCLKSDGYVVWAHCCSLNSITLLYMYKNLFARAPVFWLRCFVLHLQIRKNELCLPLVYFSRLFWNSQDSFTFIRILRWTVAFCKTI